MVEDPGFQMVNLIQYKLLVTFMHLAIEFPSFVMRVIVPPPLVYLPPDVFQHPSEKRLLGFEGICRTFSNHKIYLFSCT